MKTFLRNLSIRGKLLFGFGIITAIMLTTGIRELMVLSNLNEHRLFSAKAKFTTESVKEVRFIIKMEFGVLNQIVASETSDMLKTATSEHYQNAFRINETIDIINLEIETLTEKRSIEEYRLVRDSLRIIQEKYNNALKPAFDDVLREKDKQINIDAYYIEYEKITTSDSLMVLNSPEKIKTALYMDTKKVIDQRVSFINESADKLSKTLLNTENICSNVAISSENEMDDIYESKVNETFVFILAIILVSILIALGISRIILMPIDRVQEHINILTQGDLPNELRIQTRDEIGEIGNSLNKLVDNLKRTALFSIEIGKSDFATNYRPVSKNDVLGNSLLSMRDSLRTAKTEEEKRRTEDKQRGRTSEGLALFANILRRHTDNLEQFADDIISNLVKFINTNQGALFILKDDNKKEPYLDLIGAYAYNRKKYIAKQVKLGEGLVGAVAVEKYTVYMTDIPNEYIEIESGIGSSNPKSILIVPLKIEEEVLGVIELASFDILESYEITLVEKIAESIASTLSTARINTRTAQLLDQSEKATAMMREKEEEMLQNIEELQATQDDSRKREKQLLDTLAELEEAQRRLKTKDSEQLIAIKKLKKETEEHYAELRDKETLQRTIVNFSINGMILLNQRYEIEMFNQAAEKHFGYLADDVLGQSVVMLFNKTIEAEQTARYFLSEILSTGKEGHIITKDGNSVPVFYSVKDFIHEGATKYALFLKNIKWEKDLELQRTQLMEKVMANEFENEVRIEKLEELLSDNKIIIPEEEFEKELIKWTDKLAINVSTIDQQHKRWLYFINRLYSAFKVGKAADEVNPIFKELADYTDYHFEFEEKYMKDFGFSNVDAHKKKHQIFLDTINKYRTEYENGDFDTAYKVMNFLRKWVRLHITEDDKTYAALFRKNGLT